MNTRPVVALFSGPSEFAKKLAKFIGDKNCEILHLQNFKKIDKSLSYALFIDDKSFKNGKVNFSDLKKFINVLLGFNGKSIFVFSAKVKTSQDYKKLLEVAGTFEKAKVVLLCQPIDEEVAMEVIAKELFSFGSQGRVVEVAPLDVPPIEKKVLAPIKKRLHRKGSPFARLLFFLPVIYLSLVVFLTTLSGIFLFGSLQLLKKGNDNWSGRFISFASFSAKTSSLLLAFPSKLPVLGYPFLEVRKINTVEIYGAKIVSSGVKIGESLSVLNSNLFSSSDYNLSGDSKALASETEYLYGALGLLEIEIESLHPSIGGFLKREITKVAPFLCSSGKVFFREGECSEISVVRFYVGNLKKFLDRLPTTLGEKEPKNYLVLFQNNMELRPSGGFIGSFATVKVQGGKVIEMNVSDVYSADGQLKGHVEPPVPIKNYLAEANWYLRDSNWDPDFSVSSEKAEWFLEKEIDATFDGVVAIDLNFAKRLLQVTGPVTIKDFDKVVNSDNLYQITQEEVEKDFFPGSRKKANFLSALARSLIALFTASGQKKSPEMLLAMYKSLEDKSIQLQFNDTKVQDIVSSIGWDGEISAPACMGNCQASFVGVVDANLGVNKANFFITKNYLTNIQVGRDEVAGKLSVVYKNTANPQLGNKGFYKNYVRFLIPSNAYGITLRAKNQKDLGGFNFDLNDLSGRKEVGALLEVSPGETETVTIEWKQKNSALLSKGGKFRFFLRKQAGSPEGDVATKVTFPAGTILKNMPFSLTQGSSVSYNSSTNADQYIEIVWE